MTRLWKKGTLLVIVLLLFLCSHAFAQDTATYLLQVDLYIENTGSQPIVYAEIETPLPVSESLYGTVASEEFSLAPREITEDEHGQRRGIFLVTDLAAGETIVFTQQYHILQGRVPVENQGEPTYGAKVPSDSPEILSVAEELTENLETEREKACIIREFTHNHVKYDRDSLWRNSGALSALTHREGVCEDMAALFVALTRGAGIRSRLVYGYVSYGPDFLRHCWAEYYLPGEGWIPVDPTRDIEDFPGSSAYVAQWYTDEPIRLKYVGGRINARRTEKVVLSQPIIETTLETAR